HPHDAVGIDQGAGRIRCASPRGSRQARTRTRTGSAQDQRRIARVASGATQAGSCLMELFGGRKTVFVDADILVISGGMAGSGATYESRYWGRGVALVGVGDA